MTLSLPLFAALVLFSQDIAAVFGPGFTKSAPIISIVLIGHVVNVCAGSTGIMLSMTGKPFYNLFNSGLLCGINVLLTLLLVPRYGLSGAASAYSLSIILIQLLQLGEVWHLYRLQPYRWDSMKPVICCAGAAAVAFAVQGILPVPHHPLSALLLALFFAGTYAALLLLSGLSPEDRLVLNRIRCKMSNILA
jgi:O-antigen/teichoic acid export membrane protein